MSTDRRCGNCVMRNGFDTPQYPLAFCAIHGPRRREDAACRHWFGKEQLHAPNYGAPVTREQARKAKIAAEDLF